MAAQTISSVRHLFEIPQETTYLNCANMAPQMKSITAAGLAAVREKAAPWKLGASDWFSGAEILRGLAAQVLQTDMEGVALVPAVSYGIAIAAANLPVLAGQSIVVLDQEFPSNVYAWRELAKKRNANMQTVRRHEDESWTTALLRAIDEKTAIVAVPQCHWTDGSWIDLESVGSKCRQGNAGLVIDASQSLGAGVLNLERVQPDFLTAVGYKWLLGPYGLGYLYVAPKWRDRGIPLEQSWLTRAGSEDFARLVEYTDNYRPGARRFDMGEFPQFVLVPMAIAALEQILSWTIPAIQRTIGELTAYAAEGATAAGYFVQPPDGRCRHMIGIRLGAGIPKGLAAELRKAEIFVSIRGDAIRISPYLYNQRRDIDRLLDVLNAHRR